MQIVQRFDDWLAEGETSSLTQKQEEFLNKCTIGQWKFDSSPGLVNVDGNFDCSERGLIDFKNVNFGKISGDFVCSNNNLTSLNGAPQTVGGTFHCSLNNLTSLEGAPQKVDGFFSCSVNNLTSLKGAPQTVGGDFYCTDNTLMSLVEAPQTVDGGFYCSNNKLTSLEGAPKTVGGGFDCYKNNLTSLKGAPRTVGEYFNCGDNNLTSLEGAPQTVGDFYCNAFSLDREDWNLAGWLKILTTGTPEVRALIFTLPQLDLAALQQEIDRNPEGMLVKLKDFLKHPHFGGLKWPERLEQEKELLLDLGDIGL